MINAQQRLQYSSPHLYNAGTEGGGHCPELYLTHARFLPSKQRYLPGIEYDIWNILLYYSVTTLGVGK